MNASCWLGIGNPCSICVHILDVRRYIDLGWNWPLAVLPLVSTTQNATVFLPTLYCYHQCHTTGINQWMWNKCQHVGHVEYINAQVHKQRTLQRCSSTDNKRHFSIYSIFLLTFSSISHCRKLCKAWTMASGDNSAKVHKN